MLYYFIYLYMYIYQLREIFVLDSIFAATYLSFGTRVKVIETVFFERFEFLASLFQNHFNTLWNIKQVNITFYCMKPSNLLFNRNIHN